MKLRLTVSHSVEIDVMKVDELPKQLAKALVNEEGCSGVVEAKDQNDIEQALRFIVDEQGWEGLIEIDSSHMKVEVIDGTFNIDENNTPD